MLNLMDSNDYPIEVQAAAADELIILAMPAISVVVADLSARLASDVCIDPDVAQSLILGHMARLLARLKPGQVNPDVAALLLGFEVIDTRHKPR